MKIKSNFADVVAMHVKVFMILLLKGEALLPCRRRCPIPDALFKAGKHRKHRDCCPGEKLRLIAPIIAFNLSLTLRRAERKFPTSEVESAPCLAGCDRFLSPTRQFEIPMLFRVA